MQLPACNSVPTCPKCQALDSVISTAYHDQPMPLDEAPDPCTRLVMETPSEELEDFGEHLCRHCRRCGFGWVEQVAEAGSVYEETEDDEAQDGAG